MTGVRIEDGRVFRARCTVSTLAPWDLRKLNLPAAAQGHWTKLGSAPIIGISAWMDRPLWEGDDPFVGLIGTEVQWAFDKTRILGLGGDARYLSLVISGAHRHIGSDPKALFAIAESDLSRCFPAFRKAKILRWKAVKEPFATLSPVPGTESIRPVPGEIMPGFYLAGDWTRTGLPATIESAVKSGHIVADAVARAG